MEPGLNDPFLVMSRENMIKIWNRSKIDMNRMTESEQLLAFIMKEHEDYHEFWENFAEYKTHEFDPETEVNPFLHITIHHLVETQIRLAEPPETERVFQQLKDAGKERNEAIHMMGSVLVSHLFRALQSEETFDKDAYLAELNGLLKDEG